MGITYNPFTGQFDIKGSGGSSGSGITDLTGDVTATGPGSAVATIPDTVVTDKLLTGFVAGPNSAVLATDTILEAIQKLQAQITALPPPMDFIDAIGGTITTDGDYKIHTFTTSDTFEILSGDGLINSLVIGGGGGGGDSATYGDGGGGGAGGFVYTIGSSYGVGSYSVIVGAGGVALTDGSDSSFDVITATGGGAGGTGTTNGNPGGSGGGSGYSSTIGSGTVGQGKDGGAGGGSSGSSQVGGGGGGAGSVGGDGTPVALASIGGSGGLGLSNSISGASVYYASGGGGCSPWLPPGYAGASGTASAGGGGDAQLDNDPGTFAEDGAPNTGGGGGGGYSNPGGTGGSGIVIIRYLFQ